MITELTESELKALEEKILAVVGDSKSRLDFEQATDSRSRLEFEQAATPSVVLALITEVQKRRRWEKNREEEYAAKKASLAVKCYCPAEFICEYEDGTRHCLHCECAKFWEKE